MSKDGHLVLGIIIIIIIIILIHTKQSSALSRNLASDTDSVNGTSQISIPLQDTDEPSIAGNGQVDLRLYEPVTRTLNQFPSIDVDGSILRIRRRRCANETLVQSLENGIYYVVEPPISMLWKVLTTPLFIAGNSITAPIASFADRVEAVIGRVANILLAMVWELTKNCVLPNADKTLITLARSGVFPEGLNQLVTLIHFSYELLKFFGYLKPT